MSTATTADDLSRQLAARKEARANAYSQLVVSVAAGESPDLDTVESVLHDAGKTDRDLSNDVGAIHHRRRLRAQLDEIEANRVKASELRKEIEASNAQLERYVAEHQSRCLPIHAEIDRLLYH